MDLQMPINDLETFKTFNYKISEIPKFSHKNICCNCDNCNIDFLREMQTLSRSNYKEILCYDCSKYRKGIESKKYTCNENYFSEKSLQACYWAGFIAADGCISDTSLGQNYLSIGLSIKDENHLVNFQNHIKYDGVISKYLLKSLFIGNSKKMTESKGRVTLVISSQKLCNDLGIIFNIHPRKSLIHEHPIGLTFEQELAFIIGYIDGDGSIGILKNRVNTYNGYIENYKYAITLQACGTYNFLNWVISTLKKLTETIYNGKPREIKNNKISHFQTQGKFAYEVLFALNAMDIYKLDRKWDIVKNCKINTQNTSKKIVVNKTDRISPRKGLRQPYCRKGHEYTIENSYITSKNQRFCRECRENTIEARRKYLQEIHVKHL